MSRQRPVFPLVVGPGLPGPPRPLPGLPLAPLLQHRGPQRGQRHRGHWEAAHGDGTKHVPWQQSKIIRKSFYKDKTTSQTFHVMMNYFQIKKHWHNIFCLNDKWTLNAQKVILITYLLF